MRMFEINQDEPHSETMESNGQSLKIQTDVPYLLSLGFNGLSTPVTFHPIPEGRVVLGNGPGVDIPVQGEGVAAIHCHIENSGGVVTIFPFSDNLSVNGLKVSFPTRLSEGSVLTIGSSNYMRFNSPSEVKLGFEQETQLELVQFPSKPPPLPKKSPRGSFTDISRGDPPSSFLTKISKFEYLAAQNLRKSISPKVFASNAVTVNTPAKDVLGKSPPDLHSLAKKLTLSASETNCSENQKDYMENQILFGNKSQSVNLTMDDTNSINSRVISYENGIKEQNINLHENLLHAKTSSGNKNINMLRVITPSPSYNRNPAPYHRSTTPNFTLKHKNAIGRTSGSTEQLTHDNFYENSEDLNEIKKEDEMKRNQVQQDRIKEQELERAEQARLEEILNMCAEYEKQSQNEKNKPITPNRIKTNGSLPRDKRQQISPTPFRTSTHNTLSSSPGVFDFLRCSQDSYESKPSNSPSWRNKITSNYENLNFNSFEDAKEIEVKESNHYENIHCSPPSSRHYPNSPRSRIKTFLMPDKDNCLTKSASNIIEHEFSNRENEIYSSQNFIQIKEKPIINNSVQSIPTQTKFILPLGDLDLNTDKPANNSNILKICTDMNNPLCQNGEVKSTRSRYVSLKKEKRRLLDTVGSLKQLMSEIEIQEEELHIEMDMERALLSGEYKSKLLELEKKQQKRENLLRKIIRIDNIMQEAQRKRVGYEKACQERLKTAKEYMTHIEQKLASTERSSEQYEVVFEQYLKSQEVLESEKKSFEDLEFHHLEEEANSLATREELQREIVELKIENLESHINELEKQALDTTNANNKEYKSLESQKINSLVKLEEIRNRLKVIDADLAEYSDQESEHEMSSDTDSDPTRNTHSKYDSISLKHLSCSVVLSDAVLQTGQGDKMFLSFNEKLMEDKIILEGGTGTQVVEQETQSFHASKHRGQQQARNKLAQRIQDCSSITSTGSEGTGSGDKTDDIYTETAGKDTAISADYSDGSRNEDYDVNHRPLSEVSEMSLEGGTHRKRSKPTSDKQRPLTRYLPIRDSDLDLRQHLESAGHQVVLCPHIMVNASSCRGFLHKKGLKLNGWSRRWFVFDRNKHTFSYYADKNEKKTRGGAYFQAIEEVYLDHSKSVKSPNPQLTFIVKTHERYYYLMAPSPEAMRIWVDVIFTGAEGYQEFVYRN